MLRTLFQNKIVLLVVIVAVAGAVWLGMSQTSSTGSNLTTSTPSTDTSAPTGGGSDQSIVTTLLALRAVNLNGTIFNDSGFMSLRDLTTHVVMEPVGRSNPFAPLGASAAPTSGTTQSAQMFAPNSGQSTGTAPKAPAKKASNPVPRYK